LADDPTAFFAELYAAAAEGRAGVPWDRGGPRPGLVEWARWRRLDGAGRRALVVGSGLGGDAEFVAGLGYATVGFDAVATAVALARERHPRSAVSYVVADVLDPPAEWRRAFDLVVECLTVQSLPPRLHAAATERIAGFVAPGGTLIAIASVAEGAPGAPPWPLTRAEIGAFATGGVRTRFVERTGPVWRAEFTRPPAGDGGQGSAPSGARGSTGTARSVWAASRSKSAS
jgi:SAM-dependent methyltransferase